LGKAILLYETDRRKIQEDREILAYQFQASQRTRSLVHMSVCLIAAGLRVVGYPDILSLLI
jgi:hypothetical protein